MRSFGLLLPRLAAGTVLIGHGYTKLFGGRGKRPPEVLGSVVGSNFPQAVEERGPEKFAEILERIEVPAPKAAAVASGLAEVRRRPGVRARSQDADGSAGDADQHGDRDPQGALEPRDVR